MYNYSFLSLYCIILSHALILILIPFLVPFLPIRSDLLPKRNQARQKMATLPDSRFKELAAELYVEIEKRFPQVVSDFERVQFTFDIFNFTFCTHRTNYLLLNQKQ